MCGKNALYAHEGLVGVLRGLHRGSTGCVLEEGMRSSQS